MFIKYIITYSRLVEPWRERDDTSEVHYSIIKPTKTDLGLRNLDLHETWMYNRMRVAHVSGPYEGGKNFQRRDLTFWAQNNSAPRRLKGNCTFSKPARLLRPGAPSRGLAVQTQNPTL